MSVQSQIRAWLRELETGEASGGGTSETSPEPSACATQVRAGVTVGLSGGADSLALVHGLLRCGVKVHAVVVDHQLQEGSAQVARQAADTALSLSLIQI